MDNNPILSIVVPAYNAEQTLSIALNSALEEESLPIEIVVVNDGSSDGTEAIGRELSEADRRVVTVSQPNRGVSSARNLGIKIARGDYIGFLDADDIVLPGSLRKVLDTLTNKLPDCLRVGFHEGSVKRKGMTLRSGTYGSINEKHQLMGALMAGDIRGFPWVLFISREIANRVAFREDVPYMEDLLFNLDVISLSRTIEVIDLPVVHYLENELGASRNPKHTLRNLNATFIVVDEIYKRLEELHLGTLQRQRIASRRLNSVGVLLVFGTREFTFRRDEFSLVSASIRDSPGVNGLVSLLPQLDWQLPWILPVVLVAKGKPRVALCCARTMSTLQRIKSSLQPHARLANKRAFR